MSKEGQHDYKMILNVDGFGMASDASFWKLSSGSAVVWLMRDGIDEPVHTEWYSPLLQPYGAAHCRLWAHFPLVLVLWGSQASALGAGSS